MVQYWMPSGCSRHRAGYSPNLQRRLGLSKRELHQVLRDLALKHACAVASATTGDVRGIYIADSLGELEEYRAQLMGRFLGLKPRLDALDRLIAARRAAGKPVQKRLW